MCYKLLPVVAKYVAFLKPSIGRVNEIYRKGWCFEKCRVPPIKINHFQNIYDISGSPILRHHIRNILSSTLEGQCLCEEVGSVTEDIMLTWLGSPEVPNFEFDNFYLTFEVSQLIRVELEVNLRLRSYLPSTVECLCLDWLYIIVPHIQNCMTPWVRVFLY